MLAYQQQDCELTLAEGLDAYRAANPTLDVPRDLESPGGRFFRGHDIVHVVFGCDTSLFQEAMADAWTLFGTTVGFRRFVGFFSLPEHQHVIEKIGKRRAVLTAIRAAPLIVRIARRARQMSRKWPWQEFDQFLPMRLTEIRREFNIQVLSGLDKRKPPNGTR